MGYGFLFGGLVLALLAWWRMLAFRSVSDLAEGSPTGQTTEELTSRLASLEERLVAVQGLLSHLISVSPGSSKVTPQPSPHQKEEQHAPQEQEKHAPAFGQALAQAQLEAFRDEVYSAQDAGGDIESIARQLGRGKGEVELILNLRRNS